MNKITPDKYILQLASSHFVYFSKYIFGEQLSLTNFHLNYYRILHQFSIGKIKKLIVTVPPQHGKSLGSTQLLPSFLLGIKPDLKIAIASYSDTFAKKFNRSIQRIIDTDIYRNIFPETTLNKRNIATVAGSWLRNANEFEIVGKLGSLKAVGRGGSLTGNPVDIMIMDDLYKDAAEGNSPLIRDNVFEWYDSVVDKRLNNNSQQLIVFTRWHEDDLIGILERAQGVKTISSFKDIDNSFRGWHKINFEAIKASDKTELDSRDINEPLWPERHSLQLLLERRALDPHTFECMNQGNPSAKEGYLYSSFKTYNELPSERNIVKLANYTDTADMGEDMLCSICYVVDKLNDIYITDIVYTDEPMEVTEPATAKMLIDNNTKISYIESNNGGRGFARAIQKISPGVNIQWFNQNKNKESRILTNAPTVIERIKMPEDWMKRWPKFYNHITTYKRTFRANRWHDAPDVLTGIIEKEPIRSSKIYFG